MKKWMLGVLVTLCATVLIGGTALGAGAYANKVTYSGQGLLADGFGGYDLQTEICGVANGADVDGPYLLFVLTATGASHADITIGGTTTTMVKTGNGTFKYVSTWLDPAHLPVISASYDGKVKNAQLVILIRVSEVRVLPGASRCRRCATISLLSSIPGVPLA
jgi:hypothetical protein